VIVAVEKRGKGSGSARMAVIPDFKSATLLGLLKQNGPCGGFGGDGGPAAAALLNGPRDVANIFG
jgi:hypothetical protein